jgi:hypothetical protein
VGLLLAICAAAQQSQVLTARRATAEGRLVTSTELRGLPKITEQFTWLKHNARPLSFFPETLTGLKNSVRGSIPSPAIVQNPGPSISPDTPPASLSFLPPATLEQNSCGNVAFPDGGLAVSSNYLLQVGTSCIETLDPHTGALISGPSSLASFFQSSANTGYARALLDPVNARFLVVAEDYRYNRVFLAASQGSNPTLGWNIYSFQMATCRGGSGYFPMLGQTYAEPGDSAGGIYLSWDVYCPGVGITNFVGALSKSLVYAGAAISSINGFAGLSMNGQLVDTVQPANVMNPLDRPRGEFLVNSFNYNFGFCATGCNGVVLWDFYDGVPGNGGAQSISGVVVPTANTYYLPPNAPQPGCAINTCGPHTGLTNIGGQVTYSSGALFAAFNDSMGILALELEPFVSDSGAITGAFVHNEICFVCGGFSNGGQAYYGTIQPDSERNWVMVYNFSAPGPAGCMPDPVTCVYPSTAFVTHRVTQQRNTVHDSGVVLALGQSFFRQINSQGQSVWEDYTVIAPNYMTPNSYWFDGEYAEGNGNWGTVVGQTGYTSPIQP